MPAGGRISHRSTASGVLGTSRDGVRVHLLEIGNVHSTEEAFVYGSPERSSYVPVATSRRQKIVRPDFFKRFSISLFTNRVNKRSCGCAQKIDRLPGHLLRLLFSFLWTAWRSEHQGNSIGARIRTPFGQEQFLELFPLKDVEEG